MGKNARNMIKLSLLFFILLSVIFIYMDTSLASNNTLNSSNKLSNSPYDPGQANIIMPDQDLNKSDDINPTSAPLNFNKSQSSYEAPINIEHLTGDDIFTGSFNLPSYYDLRNIGKVSPVKDQGPAGTCWSFAGLSSLESCLLPNETWDFSEDHMKNMLSNLSPTGFDFEEGGNYYMVLAYLSRWSGPVNEIDDPYDPYSIYTPNNLTAVKHIQESVFIPNRNNSLDNDQIKEAIIKYGAIYSSIYWNDNYYNSNTHSYYYNNNIATNHAISVVGWDDNYSSNNFKKTPSGNGAFIIKNSWGTNWGENGYFYLSYYDKSFCDHIAFMNAESINNYNDIYQYDPLGYTDSYGYGNDTAWMANHYISKGNNPLAAFSFYALEPQTLYQVYIEVNSQIVHFQEGVIDTPGYKTINLTKLVPLNLGDEFYLIIKLITPNYNFPIAFEHQINGYSSKASANPDESFTSPDGLNWSDLTDWISSANNCLKAFTLPNIIYVDGKNGNDLWDGLKPEWDGTSGPKQSIKNATSTIAENGIIKIANSIYSGINNNNINIDKNLTIIGEDGTIINGSGADYIFKTVPGINFNIINLILTGVSTLTNGGAIYNQAILNMDNCTLTHNMAAYGGAVYNEGELNVNGCTFTDNTANRGSAIYTTNGNVQAHFNCVLNNSGNYDVFSEVNGVDASNNWWGSNFNNTNPLIEERVNTNVYAEPWIILSLKNSIDALNQGNKTNIISNLNFNSNGNNILNQYHYFVPDVAVTFNATMGSLSSYNSIITRGLDVTTIFTAGFVDGIANISAVVDNEILNLFIIIDSTPPIVTASPMQGIYNNTIKVTLTSNEPANIYYTLDNSTPTINSPKYMTMIDLINEGSTVLKFMALDKLGNPSPIYNFTYVIDRISPIAFANLQGGQYNTSKSISLFINEQGTIYYTLNGDNPTNTSNIYLSPININSSTVLKFFAVDLAGNPSPVYVEIYTIDKIAPTASANPKGGLYNKTFNVILNATDNLDIAPVIYYTTNGTNPNTSSNKYTIPITICAGTTILKFFAIDKAGNPSKIYNETFTIDLISPVVSVVDPLNNARINNASKIINITFSELIKFGSAYKNITVKNSSGTAQNITLSINGKVLTIKRVYGNYSNSRFIITLPINSIVDLAGNGLKNVFTSNFTIDTVKPTVNANPKGGTYNTSKIVNLSMNEPGTIYYTINGTTPSKSSNKYISPIIISSTTTLKFFALDLAGNPSIIYNQTYTIDKVAPKVNSTTPSYNATGVSKTGSIYIKFTEPIKSGINWSGIWVKNLTTGIKIPITNMTISGNTLKITTATRAANTLYQVYVPAGSVKDYAGNNLIAAYTFKFKTGNT